MEYEVYYARIPVSKIVNTCDPIYIDRFVNAFGGKDEYYKPKNSIIRAELRELYIKKFNDKISHYDKLTKALKETGDFENPIFVTCGVPKFINETVYPSSITEKTGFFIERLGGSRCLVASLLNPDFNIKCIVSCWSQKQQLVDCATELELITTPDGCYKHFGKVDRQSTRQQIKFSNKGVTMEHMEHFHVDNNIYGEKYTNKHQIPLRQQIITECIDEVKKDVLC